MCMSCMAHINGLIVDLTFGEVYDAPQRTPRSQPGLRPEPKKDLNHRGNRGHREKNEDSCGDSASVASESSVVKSIVYAEGIS